MVLRLPCRQQVALAIFIAALSACTSVGTGSLAIVRTKCVDDPSLANELCQRSPPRSQ